MSDDSQAAEPEAPQGSVFGNLPQARPGTRSPRRDAAAGATKATPTSKPSAKAPPTRKPRTAPKAKAAGAGPGPKRPAAAPKQPARAEAPEDAETEGRGLEDLAWAGVAAAAEAATLGVRLASRAMEALRGSDRR